MLVWPYRSMYRDGRSGAAAAICRFSTHGQWPCSSSGSGSGSGLRFSPSSGSFRKLVCVVMVVHAPSTAVASALLTSDHGNATSWVYHSEAVSVHVRSEWASFTAHERRIFRLWGCSLARPHLSLRMQFLVTAGPPLYHTYMA